MSDISSSSLQPAASDDLRDPALIATFYGQRGQMQLLCDHLVAQRQLIQENAITFTHEATRTLLLHFDSPGAADTSVIQLALNSAARVPLAWTWLREQCEVILNETLLHWPVWGYTLVYQAMLAQKPDPDERIAMALLPTLQAVLPAVQRLQAMDAKTLPVLARSMLPGGLISLHHVPLEHDGLDAATIYVALSLPDPMNQLVRQVLLGQGAMLLMPDLIAHKIYHQIRQYRSDGWLDHYNYLVQALRDSTESLLHLSPDMLAHTTQHLTLSPLCNDMLGRMQNLKALRISLAQQNENLPWWIEQFPGDPNVVQFHQRHGQSARRELDLLLEKGQTAYEGAQAALDQVRQHTHSSERKNMEPSSEDSVDSAGLRHLLTTYFNVSELQNICFDLGIDYESLSGQGKADKARELIAYVQRDGQITRLVNECRKLRPRVDWSTVMQPSHPEDPQHTHGDTVPVHQQPFVVMPPSPEPLQVTLRFEQTGRAARITWDSMFGTKKSTFSPPYTGEDLALVIRALDALQYPTYPLGSPTCTPEEQGRLKDLGLWDGKRISRDAPRLVGQKLYAALRRSRAGGEALKVIRETAHAQGLPVRYVLRFPPEAVELAALPWEVLWDDRQAVLLSRGGRDIDSCERYLDLDMALSPPLPAGQKLRVLALAPHAGIPQDVRDAERDARLKSWETLKIQGLLEWDELSPVTPASLDRWMRRNNVPDVVHYYGHGIYTNGQGYLLFDTDEPSSQDQYELISAVRLAALLGGIRLIVLFACQSAMVAPSEWSSGLLTGVAPALSAVSEVVVAMQLTTRISAATHFSEVFYEELARGRSVQAAVADARRSLYVTESDGMSWYVPTLYIRMREQRPIYLVQNQ